MKERATIALFITILTVVGLLGGGIAHYLYEFTQSDRAVTRGDFEAGAGRTVALQIPPTADRDRVYLVLDVWTSVNVRADPPDALRQLSYDVEGLSFEYEDWILRQQRFLFIKNGTSGANLTLTFPEPKVSYTIKAWQGESNYTLRYGNGHLALNVSAPTQQENRFQQIMLLFPFDQVASTDFEIRGTTQLISGRLALVNLILITRDRNWFSYELLSNQTSPSSMTTEFNINLHNRTMSGPVLYNDFAKSIRYIAVNFALDAAQWTNTTEAHACVGLGDIHVFNGNGNLTISSEVLQNYTVSYELHIFSKFTPTLSYRLAIFSLTSLVVAGALVLAKSTGVQFAPQLVLRRLTLKVAESDPYPDTYLAKLFHKPRYERLAESMKRHIGKATINSLVDIGCGKSAFKEWAEEANVDIARYIGVDIRKESLQKEGDLELLVCDVQHLPFRDSAFEVALCSEVFEHIEEPYLSFKEVLRISERWVFLSYPDEKVKNLLGFRYPEHIRHIEATGFESVAMRQDWRLRTRERLYFAFPPHVFDKLGLKYRTRYQPIVTFLFQLLSRLSFKLALIKTHLLVFENHWHKSAVSLS